MNSSPRRAVNRRWIAVGLAAVAAAALVAAGKLRGPQVQVGTVERRDIVQTVVASGRIMPPAQVNIGSLISSTVTEVLVREGDTVAAGQHLLRLDAAAALAQVRQAEAMLAEAQAGRRGLQVLDAPAARQQLAQAKTRLARELKAAERTARLRAQGAVTQEENELSQTNLALARSQVRAAELQLSAVSQGGSGAARASAATALAQAQLERAKVELERTEIRSPTAGIVLSRFVEPGDLVTPGASLFTVSGVGATRVVIEPDERSLSQIKLGQSARVSTEAFPDDAFDATIGYIAPSVNAKRGTIEVRLNVASAPTYIKPDMTVSTEIRVAAFQQVVVLPQSVVRDSRSQAWVYVVENNHLSRRTLGLGARGDSLVQIVDGLSEGELVVLEPTASLEPGQRIRPVRAEQL